MRPFLILSLFAYGFMVVRALRRSRGLAVFLAIILGLHTLNSVLLESRIYNAYGPVAYALYAYGQATTYLYFSAFSRRRTSPKAAYRYFISWPASFFSAAIFLALPWAAASALGFEPWLLWLPFAAAAFGFVQSLITRPERLALLLDGEQTGSLARYKPARKRLAAAMQREKPLRIVQITDPHLGPFMSESRLRGICERAVREAPDLILLTGDFLTLESQRSSDPLARSLAPLTALPGRVFACFGNHDHESPEIVKDALARAGVTLLIDQTTAVELPWGRVQILGADHHWQMREAAFSALATAHPRQAGVLRLWLLHDPGGFHCIPEGEADLVFSGHTHGGHLGFVSLGLSSTIVSAVTKMPDHGLWARGRDRLYVHRGTGHYGFPLRVGVPAEESVLEVWVEPALLADRTTASLRDAS